MKIDLNKIMKSQEGFTTKKIIIIALIVLLALAIVFMLTTRKEETIKIGAILPLSGTGQNTGVQIRDGLLLAIDEINAWGGIDGKKIELIMEDSKTDPEEGKKAFAKIESVYHPVLYLLSHSAISIALAPLAQEHQVVLLGISVMAPKLTENQEWVFRYWPTAKTEVPPVLSILEELRVKKLGILYQDDEFGRSVFELLQKEFKGAGGLVEAEHFETIITDLKESIGRLNDMEAIYVVGFASLIGNIFGQLKEENFKGFILGGNAVAYPEVIILPEVEGVYFAAPIIYNPNFPFAKEVEKKYVDRYNKTFDHAAAGAYDAIKIFAGLWGDEEISRERVKSLLDEGFTYSGVFGMVNVRPGEHDISFPLYPAQIINGEVKYR
jgi:branched-chain amino acid transport system substrate-binding protein